MASMSIPVPNHRVTEPLSSSRGSRRSENHRNTPSNRRSRTSHILASQPPDSFHLLSSRGRSPGWIALYQLAPYDCTGGKPVYSCQRWLTKSTEESGRLDHASAGIVLMIVRSSPSEFRIS